MSTIHEFNFVMATQFCKDTGVPLEFPSGKAQQVLEAGFNGKKVEVSWSIFQSLPQRWIDGVEYFGPVYKLGTTLVSTITVPA